MGNDANAAIVYGLPFEGEEFDFDDHFYHEDPDVWLSKFQGVDKPDGSWEQNMPTWREEAWDKYWQDQKGLPIIIEHDGDSSSGCGVTKHLCIREATIDGDWGGRTEIPVGHFRASTEVWDALLKTFCEKANVPFEQPRWYLLVSYG